MVFYLKYRPKKISELDSKSLVEKLEVILKGKLPDPRLSSRRTRSSGSVPHAFLFTGPKGLGKTSTARILAKSINCTSRKSGEIEPCNECATCKSINNGSNLDVMEIDGASNRGIDEIRDLREKIRLAPVSSLKKIYIIDEVHMLTTEAFNALLKTLEEPPDHVFFILCTTEPQKIPQTISSRCFHIKFAKATDEDLMHSFMRIAKGEGLKIDKEANKQIARLSDSSFRDGAKILEELSMSTKNITLDLIEKKYKTRSIGKSVLGLITSFEKRNAREGIEIVSSLSDESVDFKLFTEELIGVLHQRLLSQVEGESFRMSLEETKKLIEMLVKSHTSIKYAVLPQLPLELTIVEWCSDIKDQSLKVGERKDDLASKGETLQGKNLGSQKEKAAFASGYGEPKHDRILEELISAVKKENFSLAGILRGCRVEKFDKKELMLSTDFKFHKERLNDRKVIEMLEKLISEITNSKVKVSVK